MSDRDELTPPQELVTYIGGGDFKQVGDAFLEHFETLCGLRPDERVLDVGCGAGRMAIPLAGYLSSAGHYEGFDVVPDAIEWCRQQISLRHPNFRFQLADVFSSKYNPGGKVEAKDYTFPYEDGRFDFAFAASVFTHILPAEAGRYLSEVGRVLQPGGRSLNTFFLLGDESQALIEAGESDVSFAEDHGTHLLTSRPLPGAGAESRKVPGEDVALRVAFREQFVLDLYERAGLEVSRPIHHGGWSGRTDALAYQDIIVSQKRA